MTNTNVWPLCCVCLCVASAGCGGREYDGAQRFPLSGRVTYDGEPIDVGTISFLPLEGDQQRVSGGGIIRGEYSVPEARGAHAGKYRIEIRWQKLTGREILDPEGNVFEYERAEGLPPKYHTDSEMTVEVGPDQTVFDFHLKPE